MWKNINLWVGRDYLLMPSILHVKAVCFTSRHRDYNYTQFQLNSKSYVIKCRCWRLKSLLANHKPSDYFWANGRAQRAAVYGLHKISDLNAFVKVFTMRGREYRFLSICLKTNIFYFIFSLICLMKPNFPIFSTSLVYTMLGV